MKRLALIAMAAMLLLSCLLAGCDSQEPTEENRKRKTGKEDSAAQTQEIVPEEEADSTETAPTETAPTETEPATEAPEPEVPEAAAMTFDEFVTKTTGCWFDASTVNPNGDYMLMADLKENKSMISYWPGEMTGRYFSYVSIEWVQGNEYLLHYTEPPMNVEGVSVPGSSGTMTFTFYEDGTLGVQRGETTYRLTYGGTTTQEAAATAKAMVSG